MLTDAECKNANCPPDKPRKRQADAGGLNLEVSANGSRRWFWTYRMDGKEGRLAQRATRRRNRVKPTPEQAIIPLRLFRVPEPDAKVSENSGDRLAIKSVQV
jgi:hypothetical protein